MGFFSKSFDDIFREIGRDIDASIEAIDRQYSEAFNARIDEYKTLLSEINKDYDGIVGHLKDRIKDMAEIPKWWDRKMREADEDRKDKLKQAERDKNDDLEDLKAKTEEAKGKINIANNGEKKSSWGIW